MNLKIDYCILQLSIWILAPPSAANEYSIRKAVNEAVCSTNSLMSTIADRKKQEPKFRSSQGVTKSVLPLRTRQTINFLQSTVSQWFGILNVCLWECLEKDLHFIFKNKTKYIYISIGSDYSISGQFCICYYMRKHEIMFIFTMNYIFEQQLSPPYLQPQVLMFCSSPCVLLIIQHK